jgi:hypothetical protein
MDWNDYQQQCALLEQLKLGYDAVHVQWQVKKQRAYEKRYSFSKAFALIFGIAFLVHWASDPDSVRLKGLVAPLFGFFFFLGYVNRLDDWLLRRRINKFHRRNPEPIFDFQEPVWLGDDEETWESPEFVYDDELSSARRVLGIDETASLEQVKKAYRARVKNCHPDKVSHLGAEVRAVAEEHTKALNQAYSTILAAT